MTVRVRDIPATAALGRLISFTKQYRSGGNELVNDSLYIAFFGQIVCKRYSTRPRQNLLLRVVSRDDFSQVPKTNPFIW
ncbi:hypothetical protein LCGC14_0612130 [marine sediment metagenome]|uniref:Uncharacterized protein n=1 Tax=marine sediment metagenome TaxID=412755 RepID=A0A0F9TTM9_9ZZZZ